MFCKMEISSVYPGRNIKEFENGDVLLKALSSMIKMSIEDLSEKIYVLADRGDTGEGYEILDLYYVENEVACNFASVDQNGRLYRISKKHVEDNNLNVKGKIFAINFNDNGFSLLNFKSEKDSKYFKVIEKIYNALHDNVKTEYDYEENVNMKNKIAPLVNDNASELILQSVSYANYVTEKNDGNFHNDGYFRFAFRNEDSPYSYVINVKEENNDQFIEKAVKEIKELFPTPEEINADIERRKKRREGLI